MVYTRSSRELGFSKTQYLLGDFIICNNLEPSLVVSHWVIFVKAS
jgi:hypothetical protein